MKKSVLIIAVGIAAGYVLGARAGREKYDALVERANGIWRDPRVARARRETARYAREQAPIIRDRAQTVAKDVATRTVAATRDVTDRTVSAAKDAADRATTVAKDTADKATTVVKDTAEKTTTVTKNARDRTVTAATDVASRVGEARDNALENFDDTDEN
jgi:hypothetical protein